MSVTVADLLSLPSLRNAEVVAGKGGLQKIVSSISVLESVDPEILNDLLFQNDEFYGGEIVITSFINIKDDVELQCRNMKRLAEGGEVGLILFYVGIFMKDIDQRLIDLANAMDFVLICMPRNRLDLRYSEVIIEVTEAIFKDQSSGASMALDLLERATRLPHHQRTIDTVVKMLADRIHSTVILTDSEKNVLNEAAWPRTLSGLHDSLKEVPLPKSLEKPVSFPPLPGALLYRAQIESASGQTMEMFIVREGSPLAIGTLQQAVEIVQLALRLWSQQHDKVVISELIKAIMQDEPIKMRRLADLFHIDVASIHAMWIITPSPSKIRWLSERLVQVRKLVKQYCQTSFADMYENCLVIFMDGPKSLQDIEILKEALFTHIPEGSTISMFRNLKDTTEVRKSYLSNRDYLKDVKKIFPDKNCFTGEEIAFAKSCRQRLAGGEAEVAKILSILAPLEREREGTELKRTLEVYLLDTNMGLSETAERLYLHKNTIKYRLKCISDRLGFRVGAIPASLSLCQALAVERLLKSR